MGLQLGLSLKPVRGAYSSIPPFEESASRQREGKKRGGREKEGGKKKTK